jgi:hypothetical protein
LLYYVFNKVLQSKDRFASEPEALAHINGYLAQNKYHLSDYTLIEGREIYLLNNVVNIGKDGKDEAEHDQ